MVNEKFNKDERIKSNPKKLSSFIEIFSECNELKDIYICIEAVDRVEEYFYTSERGAEMKWSPIKDSHILFEDMGVKNIKKDEIFYSNGYINGYYILINNIKILIKIKNSDNRDKLKMEKIVYYFITIIRELFVDDIVNWKKDEDERNRRVHLAKMVANEYRYFTLLESLRECVMVAEKRNDIYLIIDINEACVVYMGMTRENLIGKDMFQILGIDGNELKNRFSSKEFYNIKKKSWISGTLYYQKENIVNFIFEDITLRKNREIEMKKIYQAIEQSEEIVVMADKNFNIEYVNPKFEKVTGYTKEDLNGMKFYFYIRYSQNQKNYDHMIEQLDTGNSWSGYITGEKSNGESYWEYGTVTPIRNELGEVDGYIKVAEDVTVKIEIETKRAEAEKELESANKAKSEFLANMSHELRTPMNGIIGSIDLLEESVLDEDQKDNLGIIEYSARNMLGLINNMLDISELEFGKISIIEKPFDIISFIERNYLIMEKMLKQNDNLNFEKKLILPTEREYIGDMKRIEQIINHIFLNAIKFTEKGTIKFTVETIEKKDESEFCFRIEDTGVGIAKEDKEKIFNIFSQIDGTYTRKRGGIGVGLSIVKKLSDLMKGTIEVESTIKEGTKFSFKLSLKKNSEKKLKNENSNRKINKILLVEDDFMNRTVMGENLRKLGYEVDIAWNGYEAIEKVKKLEYDIIFMDITMPEMDGDESLKQIRNMGIKTEIVAITGKGLEAEITEGIKAGFKRYIVKPVGREQLYDLISEIEKEYQ